MLFGHFQPVYFSLLITIKDAQSYLLGTSILYFQNKIEEMIAYTIGQVD